MNIAFAPAQLPVAPRPLPDELISSWLLRTAAANGISLLDLLHAVRLRYPESLTPCAVVDYAVPEVTLRVLSQFTRVPLTRIRKLDLSVRAPQLDPALLLRFHRYQLSIWCPRGRSWRLRYSFCPRCLAEDNVVHIRWDWCFAALSRCAVHWSALVDACTNCDTEDPLDLSQTQTAAPPFLCRSCHADLRRQDGDPRRLLNEDAVGLVETPYRSALLETAPHPILLSNSALQAFRRFVDDMLRILLMILSSCSEATPSFGTLSAPRFSLLRIIAELVRNAVPSSNPILRGTRYRRSLALWSAWFQILPRRHGQALERGSRHWPPGLRRRFLSALRHRQSARLPYDVYPAQEFSPAFRYKTLAAVFDLNTIRLPATSKSPI